MAIEVGTVVKVVKCGGHLHHEGEIGKVAYIDICGKDYGPLEGVSRWSVIIPHEDPSDPHLCVALAVEEVIGG